MTDEFNRAELDEALTGYQGAPLPDPDQSLLELLLGKGFVLRHTEDRAGGTINVFGPRGDKVGYVNGRALAAGVFGYRFSERFAPGTKPDDAIPKAVAEDIHARRRPYGIDEVRAMRGVSAEERAS